MPKINQYKLFCNTENKFVYAWDFTTPHLCPHYTYHTIDASSVEVIPNQDVEFYKLYEEGPIQNSRYKFESIVLNVPPIAEFHADLLWPIPVEFYSIEVITDISHKNDEVQLHLAPNTPICFVQQPLSVGDVTIKIPDDIGLHHIRIGYNLLIIDSSGNISNDLGMVIKKDEDSCTVNTSVSVAVTDMSSKVCMSIHTAKNLKFIVPTTYNFGRSISQGVYIPANTSARMSYKNNSLQPKMLQVCFQLEY